MQSNHTRRRGTGVLPGVRLSSEPRIISYYAAYPAIIKAVNKVFADPQFYRIYIRCADRKHMMIVAERAPEGPYSHEGVTFLPRRLCTFLGNGSHPTKIPKKTFGAPWQKAAQRIEWWRRASLPPKVNRALDAGLSRFMAVAGPSIAKVAGAKFAARVEVNRRLIICKVCDQYANGTCKMCGCSVRFKARIDSKNPALGCPLRKW